MKLTFDAFDFQRYGIVTGHVDFIAPDSSAGFENEDVHWLQVHLSSNAMRRKNLQGDIKLGITDTAEIVNRSESILTFMAP